MPRDRVEIELTGKQLKMLALALSRLSPRDLPDAGIVNSAEQRSWMLATLIRKVEMALGKSEWLAANPRPRGRPRKYPHVAG